MHTLGQDELPIDVREFATRLPQEEPPRKAVVNRAEVQEHEQGTANDHGAVKAQERHFVRRQEAHLAGEPRGQKEQCEGGQKGGVRDHGRASSNAWSIRK